MKMNFFEKRFNETRFVNVSVLESNIKAKKGTFYGRVCKVGKLNTRQVLQIVKDKNPYIDIAMVESALESMADVILDMVGQGYSVDLCNLGTFSLSAKGKIEMRSDDVQEMEDLIDAKDSVDRLNEEEIEEESDFNETAGNYDVSNSVKSDMNFAFKFSPSKELKASMKNIKMNVAIKRRKAPIIENVQDALPKRTEINDASPQVIRLEGQHLKILGESEKVGVYIEEINEKEIKTCKKAKNSSYIVKDVFNKVIKVPSSSIIQNENKTLTFLLDGRLDDKKCYCITVISQAVSGGKVGKTLRRGEYLHFKPDC